MALYTAAILPRTAGALQAVAHSGPFDRLRRRLDQDALAARGIELAQRGVQPLRVGLRLARHAQPIVDALVGPRESEHRDAVLQGGNLFVQLVRGHEPRRRARRVVFLQSSGMTWSVFALLLH